VKVLYIDESGVPELSASSPFVLLCGVLIDADDEGHFSFLMHRIKNKYNLDLDKHIHAVDIFEKSHATSFLGHTARRKKKDLRADFQREVWELIKDYGVEYYVVNVPKALVRSALSLGRRKDKGDKWLNSDDFYANIDRHLPMDIATNLLYRWALKKAHADKIKIVFESRSTSDLFTVRNHNHVSAKDVFKDSHMIAFGTALKKRVVSVAFANKEVNSAALELADIISYTCNIYFLQIKKKIGVSRMFTPSLRDSVCFRGIHRTLNKTHYIEMKQTSVRKYIAGRNRRTQRIASYYRHQETLKQKLSRSLSPANAGAQLPNNIPQQGRLDI
jgi:hypothetical protein